MVTGQKIIPLIRNSPVTRFGIKVVADAVLAALAWAIAIVCLNTGAIAVFHPYLVQWLFISLSVNFIFDGIRDIFE